MGSSQLIIKNEKQFLEYAKDVLCGDKEAQELRFEGWPELDINIKGKRYHSTLPSKLMEAFVDFQHEIDRAYALILYRAANRQKLTNEDKESLELVFKINEGSTDASSDLGDWVNGIFNKLGVVLEDMSGKQKTALYTVLIFSVAGTYATVKFKDISSKLEEERIKAEVSIKTEEERTSQIETLTESNEASVEALRDVVLSLAVEESPKRATQVIELVNEGYKNVVRSAQDADKMSIGDSTYTKAEIRKISEKPDVTRSIAEGNGEFSIESIKRKGNELLVGVIDIDTEQAFKIKVDLAYTELEDQDAIHDALRYDDTVRLTYQADTRNGEIVKARLIKVFEDSSEQLAKND